MKDNDIEMMALDELVEDVEKDEYKKKMPTVCIKIEIGGESYKEEPKQESKQPDDMEAKYKALSEDYEE